MRGGDGEMPLAEPVRSATTAHPEAQPRRLRSIGRGRRPAMRSIGPPQADCRSAKSAAPRGPAAVRLRQGGPLRRPGPAGCERKPGARRPETRAGSSRGRRSNKSRASEPRELGPRLGPRPRTRVPGHSISRGKPSATDSSAVSPGGSADPNVIDSSTAAGRSTATAFFDTSFVSAVAFSITSTWAVPDTSARDATGAAGSRSDPKSPRLANVDS